MGDATDGGSDKAAASAETSETPSANVKLESSTPTASHVSTTTDATYNVTICYDNTELIYFGIQKANQNVTEQQSSIPAADASTVSSSNSSSVEKKTHEIKGLPALREFICNHFQITAATPTVEVTPVTTSGRRGKVASQQTPTTPSSSSSRRKRGAAQLDADADVEEQPKTAKKAKLATPSKPATPSVTSTEVPEKAVLARWVDKKFYAGHVLEKKANNKYVVLFEDGARKTLPEEHIVFGQENVLPLVNEAVHALVKEETYEPGLVQSVEVKADGTYYTVMCESTTVTVTASDIYLEEDQAKVILSKNAANNPEPGSSGAGNTRKDRRQKRYS